HRSAAQEPPPSLDRDCARARRAGAAVLRGHHRQGAGRSEPAVVRDMQNNDTSKQARPATRLTRDAVVAGIAGFVAWAVGGAAAAAVPFYNWFCRATGYNGTTQVATSIPTAKPLARTLAIRFDSNVAGGLPWKFEPEKTEIEVHIGEVTTVYYTVTNES